MIRGRALATTLVGCALGMLAIAGGVSAAPADTFARAYVVDATLDPAVRTIAGTVEVRFTNATAAPLGEVALVLYPNRFAEPDAGVDDVNRPFVYPREALVVGGMTVEQVEVRIEPPRDRRPPAEPTWVAAGPPRLEAVGGFAATLLRASLPAPLAPGAAATVRTRFRTVLPERYGPFGVADGRVTALDGWFPALPALAADGAWDVAIPPRPAAVKGHLRAPTSYKVFVGETLGSEPPAESFDFDVPAGSPPTLFAAEDYEGRGRDVDHAIVALAELPARRAFALWPEQPHHERVLDAVERILRERPAGVPLPWKAILIVEAPLRLELTAPGGPSLAVISDRLLRVHRLLREFHERELAEAVYAAILWDDIAKRESAADTPWVVEGVSAALADRWLATAHPRHRTVYDWIGLLNVLAIVDRFESAPKLPFAHAFFPEARHASELRDDRESLGRDRPPGRTIFTKLRNRIGEPRFEQTIDRYLAGGANDAGGTSFRATAAAVHGEPLEPLFADWTQPYPEPLDYGLAAVELNAPSAGAKEPDGRFAHRFSILRRSARPVGEAVEIEVQGEGKDERTRLTWNDDDPRADLSITTPWRARRTLLDPDRRLLEDDRVDNTVPPAPQIVLDSADVTVTSSEFGLSGLFVARQRYDYRKDIGLVGYFSDRSAGMHVGPRLHFGPPNDATTYRHNFYGFYTLETLRGDFRDDSRPGRGDDGMLSGVGLRYDYTDEFAWDNPTDETKVRLFGDYFGRGLGSSYDYADWGVRMSFVRPLLTHRTLLAVQLMNAFSAPVDSSRVPNQGRYALGGDLAVRAVPVDERLGENVALARVELRQTIYPEVDHNFFDWVTFRHGQLRLFVDAGRVEDRRSALYRPSDFAIGVGVGVAGMYDFMGFYPAVAYLAVAQRVDDVGASGVQFLFGTRQAF
jgi:hypothetical protein